MPRGRFLFEGNEVELVPKAIVRLSVAHTSGMWSWQCLMQHVANQFTEATNSQRPRLYVVPGIWARVPDSGWSLGLKVNNALNTQYFTRRALAYPGPGILPADGINVRLTLRYSA